ncbi:MAG TPA: hypothetical protein VHS03_09410 [Gaiellaceae bacterium]|jgi:ketosteroid isomerase-like protein|nr:hypothetical protein [Gaiellaceae bacterium]
MSETEPSSADRELAEQFLAALAETTRTGNPEPLYPFLTEDVDWAPRALKGIQEVRDRSDWMSPPDDLEFEFEVGEILAIGDGQVVTEVRQLYRMKATGELASTRNRRIELTIRDGKISRYDMQVIG